MTKRPLIWHPVLFAIYPVLELFFKLSADIPFTDVVRSLLLVLALTLAGWRVLLLVVQDQDRAAFLTSLCLFWFLYYGAIYYVTWNIKLAGVPIGRPEILFVWWSGLLVGLGSRWVWRRLQHPHVITVFLSVMSIIAVALSCTRYALTFFTTKSSQVATSPVEINVNSRELLLQGASTPDIYYLIVDGYGRGDVLKDLYGIDNAAFISFLKERGFYVAEQSRSNYIQTALSLASSLNFEYLVASPPDSADRGPLIRMVKHSQVRRLLEGLGYRLVALDSGYDVTQITDADIYLTPNPNPVLNQFEGLLVINSPLVILVNRDWLDVPVVAFGGNRTTVRYSFAQLPTLPATPGPKFVFAHIVAPHPPFILDRHGRALTPNSPFTGGFEGNYFPETLKDYIKGYTEKLLYTTDKLTGLIDAILDQSATPPIIIIQADHGPGSRLNWESADESCLWERTSILNAYYLPCSSPQLYPAITPVNSFRVVFNACFGASLALLPDRVYYWPWSRPYDFVDVTEKSQIPCRLPEPSTYLKPRCSS